MRATKIIATLGPATAAPERVEALLRAGVNTVRLNFSHGSHDDHARLVAQVRETSRRLGVHVAVLQDLQGPRIRTGPLRGGGPLELRPGEELLILHEPIEGGPGRISSTYPDIHRFLAPGDRVLLDDGRLEAQVLAVEGSDIRTTVTKGGLLGEFQGINLPGVRLDIPTFTEKDREDLEFGLGLGVDWVAMSFVNAGEDARPARDLMRRLRRPTPLIAKVERATALVNLDGILRAFDGVMVARGDMGVELSPEEVPVWQRAIIGRARTQGKLVIVATQMLESMISEPRPTRAEASDVANAVWEGADAVMLSGETAIGAYPVEAVEVMARIIARAEATSSLDDPGDFRERRPEAQAVARAACRMAGDLNASAIVVLTRTGVTAHRVSRHRPAAPIIALTSSAEAARQMSLWWGVLPVMTGLPQITVTNAEIVDTALLAHGLVRHNDQIVLVGSAPFTARAPTNFLWVRRVEER
ncbi:MAG: pyruvate kinase [Chloroflexota bacterium]|nr:pyruvate kinase [Chloroflexota bacterium]MDE2969817.1 pyruvate kinase [Chloroflexota bacterium]